METKDLLHVMAKIVNVRKYVDRPVSKQIKKELYEAFSLGPASVSAQARELLIINDRDRREKIVDATLDPYMMAGSDGAQAWIVDAPLVCIVLIEKRRALAKIGDKALVAAFQEADAAIQNFRLMAQVHELQTACVREIDRERLQKNLNLPWYVEPAAILTAGYSDEKLDPPPRLPLSAIVSKEEWK